MENPLSVLAAVCDLTVTPVSFDFTTWLINAALEQDARGCDTMHVVLNPKINGIGGIARDWGGHDEAAMRWRLWNIVIPCCQLIGATVTLAESRAQAECLKVDPYWAPVGKQHFLGPVVLAARHGMSIPKLRATEQARRYIGAWLDQSAKGKAVVTLTLRNHSGDVERNSNVSAWKSFADWLREHDYHVIWLDDTNDALKAGRGYCELSVDLRLALYEHAAMNICANCGVQELLKFSSASFILMGQALTAGWQDHFHKYFGMAPGDQLPWARADQRLVYKPDSFENLQEEFSQLALATS